MGKLHGKLGNLDESIQAFKRAYALDPSLARENDQNDSISPAPTPKQNYYELAYQAYERQDFHNAKVNFLQHLRKKNPSS